MRKCSHCQGELKHTGGWDTSAADRGGNALEMDQFVCSGCARHYQHRVDERFSGDIHAWWERESADQEWQLLPEEQWPTFG